MSTKKQIAEKAEYSIKAIAVESNNAGNLISFITNRFTPLKDFLKSVSVFNFKNNNAPVNDKMFYEISKEQKKITNQLNGNNYLAVANKVTVNTIPGLSSSLTDMYEDVCIAIETIKKFESEILNPYYVYLSVFISNKDARVSSKNNTFIYKKLEDERNALTKHNAKHFTDSKLTGVMQLIDLVKRAQDLPKVFHEVSVVKDEFFKINFKSIEDNLNKCVDCLSIILDEAKQNKIQNITPEVYESLANGAYEIAKQTEAITVMSTMIIGYITTTDNVLIALQNAEKNGEF